jgi:alcohol dehydrogenase class IV
MGEIAMRWEFTTVNRIVFGAGTLAEAGTQAAAMGHKALVVTGRNPDRAAPLLDLLKPQNIDYVIFPTDGEPSVEVARAGVEAARSAGCDMVISFGGGAALDTGKAIAGLLTNEGDPLDYLEVIGKGKKLSNAASPHIAIPTTAGTGAEVTQNAVLSSPEHRLKVSLRSPLMLPRLALVDPTLTYSMSPEVTASTGLDALTQVLEAFVSNKANPMTDALCREGLTRAARSLRRAYTSGDPDAREDMSITSLFSGLALANAKLGAVHGFAGVVGGMFPAPHGAVCARLLPFCIDTNVRALQERAPGSEALHRFDAAAGMLTGNPNATASDGVAWIQELCAALNVPPLSAYGMSQADIPTVAEKSSNASSMQGNPIKLTSDELQGILAQAL